MVVDGHETDAKGAWVVTVDTEVTEDWGGETEAGAVWGDVRGLWDGEGAGRVEE